MSDEKSVFGQYLGWVAAIVGILAVVVPAVIWTVDHLTGPGQASTTPTPGQATGAARVSAAPVNDPPSSVGNATTRIPLKDVTPEKGAENFGQLPRGLAGAADYADAVVLPCPSNQVGDKSHSVTYTLNNKYVSMHVQLRPYRATSDESQVQYKFYADNTTAVPHVLTVNSAPQAVDLSLDGVQKLTIEIVCDPTGSTAILTDAYLLRG